MESTRKNRVRFGMVSDRSSAQKDPVWLFERMIHFIVFTVIHVYWWLICVLWVIICNECLENIPSLVMIWHDDGPSQTKPGYRLKF